MPFSFFSPFSCLFVPARTMRILGSVSTLACKPEVTILTKQAFFVVSASLFGLTTAPALRAAQTAQADSTPGANAPGQQNNPPPTAAKQREGGFVPGQKRAPTDPAQVARGKTMYGINCRSCHGPDLRGGDMGGPNLLRSQAALSDLDGEQIVPVIQGSRKNIGMPAIGLSVPDAKAVAAYIRSVIETIQGQGAPPSLGREAPSILVGNASEGKAYFETKCSSCHSATGDLNKIGSRISDPKRLQNTWLAGGAINDEEDRAPDASNTRTVTGTITFPSGESAEGKLVRIDDFLVTLRLADGSERTYRRNGETPKVSIHDPLQAHRDLLAQYTDKDVHDVTAYLVTLK
jgi:cytochrome c oxidase cbb3-type subunit III